MEQTNYESNLILSWSENRVVSTNAAENSARRLTISNTKLYIPVVILSTEDNAKLLK